MNRIFKVIWNQILQRWVVASELSMNRHKARRRHAISLALAGILTVTGMPMVMADYDETEESPQPAFVNGKIERMDLNGKSFTYLTDGEGAENLPAGSVEIGEITYGEWSGNLFIKAFDNAENPQIIKIKSIKNPTKGNVPFGLVLSNETDSIGSGIDHAKLTNHLIIESDIGVLGINDDAIMLTLIGFDNAKLQDVYGTGAIDFYGINKLEIGNLTSYKEVMSGHSRVILEDIHELKMGRLYLDGIESFQLNKIGNGKIEELKMVDSNYLIIQESKLNIEDISLAVDGRFSFTTALSITGTEESSTEVINNKLHILGGASLSLGSNSYLYSQDMTLSSVENEDNYALDTLSIGDSYSSDPTTITARNITLNQYASLGINESAISTAQQGDKQVTRLNLNVADTLLLGNDVDPDQRSADRRSVMKLDNPDDVNNSGKIKEILGNTHILDLTTIHHLHLAGGYLDGLGGNLGNFQTKVNHLTFEDVAGGELHIQDLSLLGNGRFEIVAGAPGMLATDPERSQLQLDKLTVESGASAHFMAGRRQGDDLKNIAYFTTDDPVITVKPQATVALNGHHDFKMVKAGDHFTPMIKGEAKRAVMQLNSAVTAADHTAIRGNGYIANTLTLGDGADLYVGNAYENRHWEKGTMSRSGIEPTYGHLAVDRLVIEAGKTANLHFSLAAGGEKGDLLTILQAASGEGNVYVSPVMSPTLTADTEGKVLIVDASNIADTDNSLNLTLAKSVSRGLYEYQLVQERGDESKGALGNGQQWYLTSQWKVPKTNPEEKPSDGGDQPNPDDSESPGNIDNTDDSGQLTTPEYSVKPNAYLANLVVANQMFTLSYEDREYLADDSGLWTNVGGSFGKFKGNVTKDQIDSKINYFTLRIGKDLVSTNEYTAGIMVAYGHASGHSDSKLTGRRADNKADGFALGAYGTYYFDETGYFDMWAQYVQTHNKVESQSQPIEKYKARGLLAAIEVGKAYALTEQITLIPQGQLTYMGVKAKSYQANEGVTYGSNRGNLQLRLGSTLYRELLGGRATPYFALNYYHNSRAQKVTIADSIPGQQTLSISGAKNLWQFKAGIDFRINRQARIGGEVSHTLGKDHYRDTKVDLKLRYDF